VIFAPQYVACTFRRIDCLFRRWVGLSRRFGVYVSPVGNHSWELCEHIPTALPPELPGAEDEDQIATEMGYGPAAECSPGHSRQGSHGSGEMGERMRAKSDHPVDVISQVETDKESPPAHLPSSDARDLKRPSFFLVIAYFWV
jgi:hypothetical protein